MKRIHICKTCYDKLPHRIEYWEMLACCIGVCDRCHQGDLVALVDAGYDWTSGTYKMDKTYDADYYGTQAAHQLASYPLVCAVMGQQARGRLGKSIASAAGRCLASDPNEKPDYRTVKGMVANDPELKGFIPAFILTLLFGWVIQKILDFIWNNWTQGAGPT